MSKFLTAVRGWMTFALALVLVSSMFTPAFAAGGVNGNVNGSFVDQTSKAPLANVSITLSSASARFTAKTDAKGSFQLIGIPVDTYTLTAELAGYETLIVSGVTIAGDQTIALGTATLQKRLTQIGSARARSVSSAFQPNATIDSTTVSGTRLTIAAGKAANTSEETLALSVPGVQLTNAGNLTIRGGLASEVGYQLDGIPFTEPFLSHNASSGFVNGLGSLQVVEGSGDASQGNVGTGVINVTIKRGTYPHFGLADLEVGGPNFLHQGGAEYGFATPNGKISDYFSFTSERSNPYYGYRSTDAANYGNVDGISYLKNDDVVNNFVYRFGKNNQQSIQVLYNVRDLQQYGDLSGLAGRLPYTTNPYVQDSLMVGSPTDSIVGSTFPSLPYQPISGGAPTTAELVGYNPTRYLKFEYDNSLDATTFLSVKAFNWEQRQGGTGYYADSTGVQWSETGGSRSGVNFDLTKTLGTAHVLTFGGSLVQAHPIWDGVLAFDSSLFLNLFEAFGLAGSAPTLGDYAPLNANGTCSLNGLAPGPNGCYLASVLGGNNIPKAASFGIGYNQTDFQQEALYLRDQWSVSNKLKLDYGLRLDTENWKQGANPYNPDLSNPDDLPTGSNLLIPGDNYLRDAVVHPRLVQPRFAASYEFDRNDSLRFGYGRSTVFPEAQTLGTPGALYGAAGLTSVPALGNTANPATWTCGSGYNGDHLVSGATSPNLSGSGGGYFRCANYAQQLYWEFDQNLDAPDAGNNIPPTQSNTDVTYSHLFKNGSAVKTTGYYSRSFSVPEFNIISQILNSAGAPISQVFGVSNVGVKKVSGLETAFTTADRPTGFVGFLSVTYTNALNSVPPLVAGEDGLPLVPKASIALGNIYRVGYISPFTATAGGQYKFKKGFRINPTFTYDRGYPIGVGNLIATQVATADVPIAGQFFYNLPQTNLNAPTYGGFAGIVGAFNATNYVDPVNPGNVFKPNISATRGTPESANAGGYLSRPRLTPNVSFEYAIGRNTFGLQVQNVFGNVYGEPLVNPYWQPVATGIGGPATGTTVSATPGSATYTYGGFRNIPADAYGKSAYIELPTRPVVYRLYYQLAL